MRNKRKILSLRWLAFAVLVTALISSVTLSRYMTTVSGTSTAQVAKFDVSLGGELASKTVSENIRPGETKTYFFTVMSQSDTAIALSAKIEGAGSLPLSYVVYEYDPYDITPTGERVNLYDEYDLIGEMDYAEDETAVEKKYILEVSWTPTDEDYMYSNKVGAWKLVILAEQDAV